MFGIPDVTVCIVLSLLVHVIVSPTLIVIGFGKNDLSPRVVAPFTIETWIELLSLDEDILDEDDCCSGSCV